MTSPKPAPNHPLPEHHRKPKGTLYLVRHAQASFGADNYDQLSELGHKQSLRLGQYWRERGVHFDAVITGTLKRHQQTWQGIATGMGLSQVDALEFPGLNEYNGHAIIEAIHPDPRPKGNTPDIKRRHFQLLREGLTAWMQGRSSPLNMPSFAEFRAGVTRALDHVRDHHMGEKILVVSSGGPISTAIGHLLSTSDQAMIELNLHIRNTAVTELSFTPHRHTLVTFNTVPHLDDSNHSPWMTYS